MYRFENIDTVINKVKLNDRSYKYFFIADKYDKLSNEEQKSFLRMISSNEASDAFTSKIQQLVASVKQNTQMKVKYMEYERQRAYDLEEGREQGLKEGRNSKAKEDAIAFLKEGISEEVISRCINIPLEDVLELKKELEEK